MPLNPVKISRPRVNRILHRKRLFKQLDSAREYPVIHITAPPGAGKSTLLSSYIEQRRLPCMWYQIDKRDQDIATLFHYLNLAAKNAAPDNKRTLPLLSQPFSPDLKVYAIRYFEELYQRLQAPCIFVFDDYQKLADDALFHDVMQDAMAQLPDGFNAVFLSRVLPQSAFARLRASNQLCLFENDWLSFTQDETASLVNKRLNTKLSDESLQRLFNTTHGWAAGIILLSEFIEARKTSCDKFDSEDLQVVFDYFAGEIFSNMPEDDQTLLLVCAFMSDINVNIAQKVSGHINAQGVFELLSDNNYFTTRHTEKQHVYQFHPLFVSFLIARARATFSPQYLIALQRRIASLLADHDQIESAVSVLLKAEDWQRAAPLIVEQASVLMEQGRHRILQWWFADLPPAIQKDNPWLLYWHGACRLVSDTEAALVLFRRAFDEFLSLNNSSGVFLSWCGAVEAILFSWVTYDRLDTWLTVFGPLREKYKRFPTIEISARVSADMHTILLFRRPNHPDLPFWERRVTRLMRLLKFTFNAHPRVLVGVNLFYQRLWCGDLRKAKALIDSLRPARLLGRTNAVSQLAWYTMFTLYSWLNADYDSCEKFVENGLNIAAKSGVHFWDFLLILQAAHNSLSSNDLEKARLYRERLYEALDQDKKLELALYHEYCAQLACRKGDMTGAADSAATAVRFIVQVGMVFPEGCFRMLYAEILYEIGERSAAACQIEQAKKIAITMQSKLIEFRLSLLESSIALNQNQYTRAGYTLEQALTLGRQQGYLNWLFWRPEIASQLLNFALENNIETEYVQRLIRLRKLSPTENQLVSDAWPFNIEIKLLGDFSIKVDGDLLPLSGKSQKKPLELLKMLIAIGNNNVSVENITEALWPDARGDAVMQTLYTTLHRLRKYLRYESSIELKDGRIKLNSKIMSVDVWQLSALLKKVHYLLGTTDPNRDALQKLYSQIRNVYRGPCLRHEAVHPSILGLQESLHARMLRIHADLGRFWEQQAEIQLAINCYKDAIETDPLAEEFYQHLMLCYYRHGHTANAVTTFYRCRKILANSLGVMPSQRTVAIYKDVQNDNLKQLEMS